MSGGASAAEKGRLQAELATRDAEEEARLADAEKAASADGADEHTELIALREQLAHEKHRSRGLVQKSIVGRLVKAQLRGDLIKLKEWQEEAVRVQEETEELLETKDEEVSIYSIYTLVLLTLVY